MGITFFLIDGKTDVTDFSPGGKGNALGFAPLGKNQEGMKDSVVGVAFDANGIFSKKTRNKPGGPGKTPDSVSVRTGGDGQEGYEYIAGTEKLEESIDRGKSAERPDQDGKWARHVSMTFSPKGEQLSLTVKMQFGAEDELETLLSDIEIPGEIPETVKLGIVSTTGGRKHIHEVNNVEVTETVPEAEDVPVVETSPAEVKVEDKPESASTEERIESVEP